MRKVFRKNEKSMLQNCNKKAKKEKGAYNGLKAHINALLKCVKTTVYGCE